jgi:MFS transporter, ACS family, allantoate permease
METEKQPSAESHGIAESESGPALTAEAAIKAVKAGNAKEIDIAAQIIAEYGDDGSYTWTAEEDKKLIRRVDWRLIPIVSDMTQTN